MGGGGAMRTASKFTGFNHFIGFRQLPPGAAEVAARKSARPPPAISSAQATDVVLHSSSGQIDAASVDRPSWELDDWEFAGGDGMEFPDFVEPPPRVVFGAPPTMEEAREATSDLREALERIYFSSSITSSCESSPAALEGSVSGALSSDHAETKACVTSESASVLTSVPKPVINAFYLLKESPEVQNVVASLAADKNVWDAVMKNEKVMEFYQSQQACAACVLPLNAEATEEFFVEHGSNEKAHENWLQQFMGNIKLQVAKMVSNLSEFLQNFFGSSGEQQNTFGDDGRAGPNFFEKAGAASFFVLGILAIIVVMMKRK